MDVSKDVVQLMMEQDASTFHASLASMVAASLSPAERFLEYQACRFRINLALMANVCRLSLLTRLHSASRSRKRRFGTCRMRLRCLCPADACFDTAVRQIALIKDSLHQIQGANSRKLQASLLRPEVQQSSVWFLFVSFGVLNR